MNATITKEKVDKYLSITAEALKQIKISNEKSFDWKEKAEDFLDMATRYFDDAKYYKEKGDFVTAFASVSYAHGWLDAGARLGLFDVKNKKYFTID